MEPLSQPTTTNTPATNKPDSDQDVYVIDGKEYDRVTHVLHKTKATDGLNKWYSLEERKALIALLEGCETIQQAKERIAMKQAHAAEEIRDDKADLGKAVHAMIERQITGRSIPESVVITAEAVTRFNFWLDWAKGHVIEPVPGYEPAEHTVHSDTLMVAGTLDLHLLVDGKEKIMDTKTGKSIYRDAAIQDAMYALLELEGRARDSGDEETLIKFEQFYDTLDCPPVAWPGLSILHIPDDGCFEYAINPAEVESYVRCFLARLRAFRCDAESKPFRRLWPKEETRWLRLK